MSNVQSDVTLFPQTIEVSILHPNGEPVLTEDETPASIVMERQVSKIKTDNFGNVTGGGNAFYWLNAGRGGLDLPDGLDQLIAFDGVVCEMGKVDTSEKGNPYRRGLSTVTVAGTEYQFKVVIIEGKQPFGLDVSLTKKPQNGGANLKPRGGAVRL